jgi:G3E family GTPase
MLPLTILTGFLGAGKTTALNRVLKGNRRRRVAVIVNELGRIDIDGKILRSAGGDVIELPGGCVCHEVTTQDELWTALDEITTRSRVDCVVLETTGIAEPRPIIDGLAALPEERRPAYDAGVVTVVDAEAGLRHIERHEEARAQIAAADRILMTKLDVAAPETLLRLHEALAGLNPLAEKAAFPASVPDESVAAWMLNGSLRRAPLAAVKHGPHAHGPHAHGPHAHGPHAHSQMVALSFSSAAPLLADSLLSLCRDLGARLVRAKGFVNAFGEPRRGYLDRAGDRLSLRFDEPWPPGPRRSDLVFIGSGIDAGSLERQLWAIQVQADPSPVPPASTSS